MDSRTRRDWLITIGQTAAGVGVASNLHLAGAPADTSLPPGVYLPSTDHLGHALMSAERFHPVPPGCPTDYIQPRTDPFQPAFFTAQEFAMIQRLTQLLLGEDDAAISAEVAEWVDLRAASAPAVANAISHLHPLHKVLAVAYFGPSQMPEGKKTDGPSICRDGLEWISTAAQSRHGSDFLSLRPQQQAELLQALDQNRVDRGENAGTRFFQFLKGEVIRGFYTSQAGLKELDFKGNAFYARSPGCSSKPSSAIRPSAN